MNSGLLAPYRQKGLTQIEKDNMKKLKDEFVKGIFDNVRNLVLSSVVIAVGVLIARNNFNNSASWYLAIIGVYTILMGFGLFAINVTHAWTKFQELKWTKYSITALSLTYALLAIEFVRALWVGKVTIGL